MKLQCSWRVINPLIVFWVFWDVTLRRRLLAFRWNVPLYSMIFLIFSDIHVTEQGDRDEEKKKEEMRKVKEQRK
jgi:hypothetical protein